MTHREFTIERQLRLAKGIAEAPFVTPAKESNGSVPASSDLVEEVRALRADLAALAGRLGSSPVEPAGNEPLEGAASEDDGTPSDMQALIAENESFKREIARMVRSMAQAKEQIAAIKHPDESGDQVNDASNELQAIVTTTERATNTILEMGEGIQNLAERLNTLMGHDEDVQSTCGDIINKVNYMFEACNFQDITGQRVTKVVITLQFIEERLRDIINAWGKEAFADIPIPAPQQIHATDDLVNGPAALDTGLSQDEIDSLFG